MKKLLLAVIISAFTYGANAQEQGQFAASANFAFGTAYGLDDGGGEAGAAGFNIGLEYFVTDKISVAPSFTLFFGQEVDLGPFGSASANFSALNIDGRYYFLTDNINVYGLIGPSIVFAKSEVDIDLGGFFGGSQTVETTDSEFGVNIGAGVMYPLNDNLGIGAQVKYQTPFDGQLVISGGINYRF